MSADAVLLGALVGAVLQEQVFCRLRRHHVRAREAMMRRIGWGFGYGAGVVDHSHGRYDPRPPPEGYDRGGVTHGL